MYNYYYTYIYNYYSICNKIKKIEFYNIKFY